jgi:hypothetical protein
MARFPATLGLLIACAVGGAPESSTGAAAGFDGIRTRAAQEAHPPIVFSTLADIPTPPQSCATVVDPVTRRDDGSVDSGGWWRFPINANPWIGEDWLVIRLIWLQTFGLPTGPDGPPLSGRSASRYSSLITQNVQFGYVALYAGLDQRVGVFALAFTSEAKARAAFAGLKKPRDCSPARSFASGTVVAHVVGTPGECYDALERHVARAFGGPTPF